MKSRTPKKNNLWRFIIVIAILFSLPLIAIGKTAFLDSLNKKPVQSTATRNSQFVQTSRNGVPKAGHDWPTWLYNVERTSATDENILTRANVSHLTKMWSFKTGDIVAASAAVVDGVVYIGSWDGYEYALDEMTGALKWRTFLGITHARPVCDPAVVGITSSATVQDGVVYVGGGDAYWYALNAHTGEVLWKVYTGDNSAEGGHYNWSSPLIYKGYAYIGVASEGDCPLVQGEILKVSLAEHRIVYDLNLMVPGQPGNVGAGVWTSPSVDPTTDTIFISSGTAVSPQQSYAQAVFSIDANTMQIKSSWSLPGNEAIGDSDFDTTPILFNDARGNPLVASVNKNGFMYVFNRNDIATGPVWKQEVALPGMCPRCENSTVSSSAFGQGTLYAAAGDSNIDGINHRGSITALDPTTGKYLWQRAEPGPVISSLVYSNGMIITAAGRSLEVLDATTGRRLYSYTTGEVVYSTPVLAHGQIFMGSSDGSVYAFSLPTTQPPVAAPDNACPSQWSCQDINNPVLVGSETGSGASMKVLSGGTGIRENSDQFHFISQPVFSDAQINIQISSQKSVGIGGITQQGLMFRQNNDPGSPYYAVLLTTKSGVVVQYRSVFGGITTKVIPMPVTSFPLYLRIARIADQFYSSTSNDGVNYTLVPGSNVTLVMPDLVSAGLAVSSGETETMNTVVFKNWYIVLPTPASDLLPDPAAAPAPSTTSCPDGWTCTDIGNPAITGSQSVRGKTWTVQGSGTDIWNDYDQFHFIWQHLTGDGSLTVHITSHQAGADYAKVGLIVRENMAPDSPYFGVYLESGKVTNGIATEVRDTQGLIGAQYGGVKGPAPASVYLKLVRYDNGTKFEAYYSADGQHWTFIPNSIYPLPMEPLALWGIAITSHDPNAVSTATFDSVTLTQSQ